MNSPRRTSVDDAGRPSDPSQSMPGLFGFGCSPGVWQLQHVHSLPTDREPTIDDSWQNAGLNFALQNIADRLSRAEVIRALG